MRYMIRHFETLDEHRQELGADPTGRPREEDQIPLPRRPSIAVNPSCRWAAPIGLTA